MPKKKVTEEGVEEQVEEETVTSNPEAESNPLDKVIAEAPELADVIKNPWLYSEWLNKLRGLQK